MAGSSTANGFTIANLQINRRGSDDIGLFSRLSASATIRNLGLLNVDIKGNNDVGGLIGENVGRVVGCFVTGEIIANNRVGGLIGSNGSTNGMPGGVINSYAEAIVGGEVDEDGMVISGSGGISDVGGLVGQNVGHTIYNSYAGGRVRGTGNSIGGLVGWTQGDIINSYATANVTGGISVGGLVGQINTTRIVTFQNNYATGEISGSRGQVGGLIGAAPASIYVIGANYFQR